MRCAPGCRYYTNNKSPHRSISTRSLNFRSGAPTRFHEAPQSLSFLQFIQLRSRRQILVIFLTFICLIPTIAFPLLLILHLPKVLFLLLLILTRLKVVLTLLPFFASDGHPLEVSFLLMTFFVRHSKSVKDFD